VRCIRQPSTSKLRMRHLTTQFRNMPFSELSRSGQEEIDRVLCRTFCENIEVRGRRHRTAPTRMVDKTNLRSPNPHKHDSSQTLLLIGTRTCCFRQSSTRVRGESLRTHGRGTLHMLIVKAGAAERTSLSLCVVLEEKLHGGECGEKERTHSAGG
jgi:hypothetical protein